MCNPACLEFVKRNVNPAEVHGKRVLEVGSYNVNGSARAIIMPMQPDLYLGTDITSGPCVDFVCSAETLPDKLPAGSFDMIISTEMLEHCGDWRLIIHNMKIMPKTGGCIIITTRSKGFPYHEWPIDHWRFEVKDMLMIFSDFIIDAIEPDPSEPGVFIKATKPVDWAEVDLSKYKIHEIIKGQP